MRIKHLKVSTPIWGLVIQRCISTVLLAHNFPISVLQGSSRGKMFGGPCSRHKTADLMFTLENLPWFRMWVLDDLGQNGPQNDNHARQDIPGVCLCLVWKSRCAHLHISAVVVLMWLCSSESRLVEPWRLLLWWSRPVRHLWDRLCKFWNRKCNSNSRNCCTLQGFYCNKCSGEGWSRGTPSAMKWYVSKLVKAK